jgi:predicted phosphodiesterase
VRVAALYDIHGNLPAFQAVLVEVEKAGVDRLVIGGDFIWGPFPRETIELLQALGDRAVVIAGNSEREVVDRLDGSEELAPHLVAPVRWTAEQLSEEELEFVASLPKKAVLDIDGLGPTLFCHGSPRSDRDRITVGTAEEKVLPWLAGVSERVVVCGHTHAQFDRRFGEHRVVNAGSVGLQFGEQGAYWAMLGPDVDLRRAEYDYATAAARLLATTCPVARTFADRVLAPPPARTAVERWG